MYWLCVWNNNNHNNSNDNNDNINTDNSDNKSHYEQGGTKSKDIDWKTQKIK